jgi:Predicted membrane protein (DUF2177)
VNRQVVLYLATLIVLVPVDFLFLGFVAKGFFAAQVGDRLGEIRPAPAILFYLLYAAGILIFVSGPATATWQTALSCHRSKEKRVGTAPTRLCPRYKAILAYFGCGTIRRYGFGAFQPCG